MKDIQIRETVKDKWPELQLFGIECEVQVVEKDALLWKEIIARSENFRQNYDIPDISKRPAIASSRKAYKAFGKDPARYRLSAEALSRRILKGNELYQINNVVDLVNLCSLTSGFSIGGYDLDKIQGEIILGIGKENEPYDAIGRGALNIANLPVLRDNQGAFGSPTSDSQRTCVSLATKRFLMVFFVFGDKESIQEARAYALKLLEKHTAANNTQTKTW